MAKKENFKDLTGMKFGHLTVIKYVGKKYKNVRYWLCECDCKDKTRKEISESNLFLGNTNSCGCIRRKTTEEYKKELEEINKKNNTNIKLKDGVEYIGAHIKITHICTCGKEWNVKPNSILSGNAKSCNSCNLFNNWCIKNNRQDILDRWDYKLNDYNPDEITFSTTKKYYFKCPRGIHESELKRISDFTNGQDGSMNCKACNSLAQWGIDNIGDDFLEKYWDYEKNNELGIDPWEISYGSQKFIWIKCQEKDYHGSYNVMCSNFSIQCSRCPYCSNRHGKIHPLDSLGTLYPQVLKIWSNNNKKSPYEYAPFSMSKVYWRCPEGKHEDYKRLISNSNQCDFRCPECEYSKGEERISNELINKGFIKISLEEFNLLTNDNFNKNYYIPQMKFDGLVGINNGLLSYDFYLPKLNLLIEYQGEQHERYIPGFHETYEDFEKQLEHDHRKKEYTINNNINLLEIWYKDFDKIEEILEKEVFIHK